MPEPNLDKLKPEAAGKLKPFLDEVLAGYREGIHSIHVTGTAVTDDFNEKVSDVNSIFVLNEMDLKFLGLLAPLGKKYGKQKVAAPLVMTPAYIESSLDVFPIEFLNFKRIHATVYGEDILNGLAIDRTDLRIQCERELKSKLIWLRQGYVSSQGDKKLLKHSFVGSISGIIPLFRGIIMLFGKEPPVLQNEVISVLEKETGVNTGVFARVLNEKHGKIKLAPEEVNSIFVDYYAATEKLGEIVDEIKE